MLEAVLRQINNWFMIPGAAREGRFEIASGALRADFLLDGQYYRIIGSVFNDGLHQHPDRGLVDEVFEGAIYPMAVPAAVIELAEEIEEYTGKCPESDKVSESFGGYSYTRAAGGASSGWRATYRDRLNRWKKV